jgi:surface polysaccharide O-acyltransferase-like enzyme
MVVGLHSSFLDDISHLASFLTVNGLFRIAVPIFFIINGYYFYNVLKASKGYSWFRRVLNIYFIWMLFYSYYWLRILPFDLQSIIKTLHFIIFGYHHLWYISGLLGASICVYKLRNISSFSFLLLLSVTFIAGVLIQYLGNYHFFDNTLIDKLVNFNLMHRNFLLLAFPFFGLGYLINKFALKDKVNMTSLVILCLLGTTLLLSESYINYMINSKHGGVDNYLSLLFICPPLFLMFLKFKVAPNFLERSKWVSLLSSAIYFIHPFIISVLKDDYRDSQTMLTFSVIAISLFLSVFIIKINKVKTIL